MFNSETSMFRSEHHTTSNIEHKNPRPRKKAEVCSKAKVSCACQKLVKLIAHANIPECSICTSVIIEPVKLSVPLCSEHFLLKDIVHLWKLMDELVMKGRNTSCV